MKQILITGANRGLGLEFVRQFLERGDTAGCREPESAAELHELQTTFPEHLNVVRLDVADAASIAAARAEVEAQTDRLDWLINNAGTFATGEAGLNHTDAAKMAHVYAVNCIGPVIMAQQFAPLLAKGERPLLANLTSGVGLLTDEERGPGGQYSYRATKSALNLLIRSLSFDLKPHGIMVVGIGPGFVLTDMTRGSSVTPPLLPPESVRGMIATLEARTFADTGRFYDWSGNEADWMRKTKA
jgi:NAD(P)-dependent dehydrogenase (short-subunit alcohol dehydrogenase family)